MPIIINPLTPLPGETVTMLGQPSPNEGMSVYVFQLTAIPPESGLDSVGDFLVKTLPGSFTTASEGPSVSASVPATADVPASALAVARAEIEINTFVPDVAGVYEFSMWEIRKYSISQDIIDIVAQTTETVEVIKVLTLEISDDRREHRARVEIGVDNTDVKTADMVAETTEVARIAADSDEVQLELTRMVDQPVAEIGEAFVERVAEYQRVWNFHVNDAAEHVNVNTDYESTQAAPTDVPGALDVLNDLWIKFIAHTEQQGAETLPIHTTPDMAAFVSVAPATNLAQGQVLEAQLSRLYADHRRRGSGLTPPIHVTANGDRTNGALKSVQAAILEDVSAGTFTDFTTEANDTTPADVQFLPPVGAAWEVGDAFYFGMRVPFIELLAIMATAASGVHVITWEYSDAAGTWTALSGVVDDTSNWTNALATDLVISWTDPEEDWATATVNNQGPFYFVRARVTTGDPAPVTQPLGDQSFRRISPEILPRTIYAFLSGVINTQPAVAQGELEAAADAASLYGFS